MGGTSVLIGVLLILFGDPIESYLTCMLFWGGHVAVAIGLFLLFILSLMSIYDLFNWLAKEGEGEE
jgi:hypothetical protein